MMTNKGIGAGGKNTTTQGIFYETNTNLDTEFTTLKKLNHGREIVFTKHPERIFVHTMQHNFFKYMHNHVDNFIKKAHGCKKPDEVIVDEHNKTVFFIEKKFQTRPGSVCEKLQTCGYKRMHLNKIIPNYEFFKTHCEAEVDYIRSINIPLFWGSDKTYKNEIIDFIVNYKSESRSQPTLDS